MNVPVRVVNAVIRDREGRLLLCKKRDFWTLPGGKAEADETDEATLRREVAEEVLVDGLPMKVEDDRPWKTFAGVTPSGKPLEAVVRFADVLVDTGKPIHAGVAEIAPRPGDTITETAYEAAPLSLNLTETTRRVVTGLLDREGALAEAKARAAMAFHGLFRLLGPNLWKQCQNKNGDAAVECDVGSARRYRAELRAGGLDMEKWLTCRGRGAKLEITDDGRDVFLTVGRWSHRIARTLGFDPRPGLDDWRRAALSADEFRDIVLFAD